MSLLSNPYSPADYAPSRAIHCPPELEALHESGFIAASDVHLVRVISKYLLEKSENRASEYDDPAQREGMFIGIALASAITRQGHVCADLANLPVVFRINSDNTGLLPADIWPFADGSGPDIDKWKKSLLANPKLCVDVNFYESSPLPASFLVLDDNFLYLRRYYDIEKRTAELVVNRLQTAHDPLVNPYESKKEPSESRFAKYLNPESSLSEEQIKKLNKEKEAQELLFRTSNQLRFGCYGLQPKPALERAITHLFGIDKEQKQAGLSALTSRFTVLAGGPGTGKTATLANIVALAQTQTIGSGKDGVPSIGIAALSGKAGSRVKEALLEAIPRLEEKQKSFDEPIFNREALEAIQPMTISKLLGKNRNIPIPQSEPHPYDLLIIDEVSMVSLYDLHDILNRLDPNTHILLVGDPNQLQSIQVGTTLLDVMKGARDSGFESQIVQLKTNYRSDKTISYLADAVILGDTEQVMESITWLSTDDNEETFDETVAGFIPVKITQRPSRSLLGDTLINRVVNQRKEVMELAQQGEVEESLEQSLSLGVIAVHRKGRGSVEDWNQAMDYLVGKTPTPYGLPEELEFYNMWAGRPVMVTKNDDRINVKNGDIGIVYEEHVEATQEGEPAKTQLRIALDGNEMRYQPLQLPGLTSVHALTVHKSQGSQYRDVIVLLPPEPTPLLTRELLYTGITRAKKSVLIIGTEAILRSAVENPQNRASQLAFKIGQVVSESL